MWRFLADLNKARQECHKNAETNDEHNDYLYAQRKKEFWLRNIVMELFLFGIKKKI